ncbi:bifunctional 4-hydroxy-2-oxoglutarate aldolase/2-dehydro-3-deoxy-phosphogluconate aldolase [Maritimibacter dapengensis]|uniref:Bifunctional 4-hydroxy-2-oxoglutarate aldolase/2-dehydro-3-deoxy-phosphogluconate aldolase n=1 Tax=Maritimibacter dapengensis TaxID=2836868 RepID=A0ABS6T3T9_9RHOB|nr:bifunctional 4-hydroxy-2-oxoglutarate aldolase/2-dehydro-3-deoxy-phosphogluconate aldolase [Maritimibacter dapengensis]MBV7379383.1 bifunctional 4-hydroxy-2-oxoglutarate aldolase/2-dehydro-3-deoxy-phosphogluconate aldolase [Maritimibacter dapengensis]
MEPATQSQKAQSICELAPIIPVLIVETVEQAEPLARALVAGGLPALEVTLRTEAALDVIAAMSRVEGGVVGAGTLLTPDDVKRAVDAGAQFGVSPGSSDKLLAACEDEGLALLPGAASATEAMRLLEAGYFIQKFFPAEAAGGAPFLKSLSSPLPQISFCPTGGVSPENATDYLSLPNVICAGGSWVAPKDKVKSGDWDAIEALARNAAKLPR